ncbi:MAG TPA: hypothetical protein PK984_06770 [Paludibacteraceae bacterium]|nr:hypothetical protein [Paludibacteraceae bacterium]
MKTKLFLTILLAANLSITSAQLAMGNWRTHLAYNQITQITQSDEKVFAISDGALFSINKYDESIEVYSKIFGLSDNKIVQIQYSHTNKLLFIAYENSNIDLITDDGEIFNLTDIYRKNISGSKKINDILFIGEKAYLSCDFGIVVINLTRKEVADTYIIGPEATMVKVKSLANLGDKLYAITDGTIFVANTSSNMTNYQNWTALSVPIAEVYKKVVVYDDGLLLLTEAKNVHRFKNDTWEQNIYTEVTNLTSNDNALFVCYEDNIKFFLNPTSSALDIAIYHPQAGLYDSLNSLLWIAAYEEGVKRSNLTGTEFNVFKPNGPATNYAWRMKYSNGKIIVVPGGRWAVQYFRFSHVMMYENSTWSNIFGSEIEQVTSQPSRDFVDVAIDPTDNTHFFVASYGIGLYEFRNNKFYMLYNNDNSNIETIFPGSKITNPNEYYFYHRVDGLVFDKSNNLLLLNMGVSSTVKYMTPDPDGEGPANGIVKNLPYADIKDVSTAQDILISGSNPNHKWVSIPRASGSETAIFTFDDNGTYEDMSDDKYRYFNFFYDQDNNRFMPQNFLTIALDKDNVVWVGTDKGPILLDNPESCFDEGYKCTRIKIPRNDGTQLADYLLENKKIKAIAVDGANRKWIGTEGSGVFLLSPNGQTTIHHFTTENSPLLSNNIISITINEKTGEVFFGTGNGIISYQSDAIEGGEKFENVHAYPNPVRENYHGLVSITGLIPNSIVKITDVNGHTVFETTSNGGIATWDCTRKGGNRVATGIYIAMCFSKDGKQYATTKILIIN